MKILLFLLSTLFGVLLGVLGLLMIQDYQKSDKQIKATEERIKQTTEKIEKEKKEFYGSIPTMKQTD